MQIAIIEDQLVVNNVKMSFPLSLSGLTDALGNARHVKKKHNHIYTWDDAGILGYSQNGKEVEGLVLDIHPGKYDFSPKTAFQSSFMMNEIMYADYFQSHTKALRKVIEEDDSGTLVLGELDLFFDIEDHIIKSISITQYIAPAPKVYSDKYAFKPIEGEKMEFTDFNFKLAVIQQLMYVKNLLQPVFDLYEFVENYQPRKINVEKEGYAFIPEVTAYFESLEIDRKFADEITEIQQDGGDDIYLNMLRFWSGEDDTFNIQNFEDVRHFKNLQSMNLFYADNFGEIKAYLSAQNIEADMI
ncbi:hypothetical protein CLV59_10684 [Chitinophaga dinghuensis]|uniref:Uncharacterized protein n=1 Tax=Chitinophaga dinghuensis TaxID=1539050 RepID=A0A327VW17_9BACT|nr:hypothetical protein [Chitinophaga dinghuensis]RAJ79024.1 hypothetical protein CLV59_10684 [Chitinophaga dinghuensis]